jgi:hypothetical protein
MKALTDRKPEARELTSEEGTKKYDRPADD